MNIKYNPIDRGFKSERGAVKSGDVFRLKIESDDVSYDCFLIVRSDDDGKVKKLKMDKIKGGYTIDLSIDSPGLYWYCFKFSNGVNIGRSPTGEGEIQQYINWFQLLIFDKNYQTPQWIKGGIIYQIFPDRFFKSGDFYVTQNKIKREDWGGVPNYKADKNGVVLNNDFFGGNLKGIRQKLPYLKSLNVSVLYLNPIFEAFSNHRYDTGDYEKIDNVLGTEEDLVDLIKACDELGIKIILDGVFNHTGDNSKYFNKYGNYPTVGAYQSELSPYYSWYTFYGDKDYVSWWGINTLPTINKKSSSFETYIAGKDGILQKYLDLGVAGVRLDVVDEIPDSFVKKIRERVKTTDKDAVIIGEVWEDATTKIAYSKRRAYFYGNELDSVMNYELKNAIINYVLTDDACMISKTVKTQINNYPKQSLDCLMNFFGTHDTPRILTVLGRSEVLVDKDDMANSRLSPQEYFIAVERLKAAAVILFTVYGVPSVYYGDEVGMEGDIDPFNRRCFPWGEEDREILQWFQLLSEIRTSINLFKEGELNILYDENGLFIFERTDGKDNVVVAVNRGDRDFFINFDGEVYDLLSKNRFVDRVELKSKNSLILHRKLV